MSELALFGGPKAVTYVGTGLNDGSDMFKWPIVTKEDEDAVLEVLRRGGMSGTDVAEMKNYLIDKGYLQGAPVKGTILFDTTIENALKAFLADVGLEWAGQTDSDIVFYVKKKYNE